MSQATDATQINALNEAAVQRELSVEKSVETVRNIPATVFSNLAVCVFTFAIDPAHIVASGAVYIYALVLFHNALIFRAYLLLRKKPRPKNVRARSHRVAAIYSFIGGMSWAIFTFVIMATSPSDVAFLVSVFTITCGVASLFVSTSSPWLSLTFCLPILTAFGFGAGLFGHVPLIYGIGVWAVGTVGIVIFAITNAQTALARARLHVQIAEERAERIVTMEHLSRRLGKYISPQLYHSIFSGQQQVEVAAQRKKLTVLFSDIVGFTAITERLESEELTSILNRYLTEMSQIALDHGGTIDKFIGDAVVVYFGDSESAGPKGDAVKCVQMALAMRKRLAGLREEWRDLGLDDSLDLRIGINTGFCTVGNFGSEQRMDYTIIGTQVNLAARLEASAEAGGILLAQETHALVKDAIVAEPAGTIVAKGFSRPVETFRVIAARDASETSHRAATVAFRKDPGQMSASERKDAQNALKEALQQLE